ncbi:hypothetical protein RCS94_06365 [Orbaceae bacterium ac157xtp]
MSINNKLFPVPFANNAGNTWKYPIPQSKSASDEPNKASYEVGFPAITMTDIAAGGIPFFGQDVNGVLNDITTAIRYMQAGNFSKYDTAFANAIGGYSVGAVILGSDNKLYRSKVDNNKQNPVNGSNWEDFNNGNYLPATTNGKNSTVANDTDFTGTLKQAGSDVITTTTIDNYQGLGCGQTWRDVTKDRKANIEYVNNTGKPIQLNIVLSSTGAVNNYIVVGGVRLQFTANQSSIAERVVNIVIPTNTTYKIENNFTSWNELR